MHVKVAKINLDAKVAELDKEIQTLENQLKTVEDKISGLKKDVLIYVGFIVGPEILIRIIGLLALFCAGSVLGAIFSAINVVLSFVFSFALPFLAFHLIKSLYTLWFHRERKGYIYQMPKVRGKYSKPENIVPEETFVSERHKVWMVLNKYYLYREGINRQLEEWEKTQTHVADEEFDAFLDQFVFYEQIRTPDPFAGPIARRAEKYSWITFWVLTLFCCMCLEFF